MNNEQTKELLTALLDCGALDLDILSDCEYDFDTIVYEAKFDFDDIDINTLCSIMFEMAFDETQVLIDDKMSEYKVNVELIHKEELTIDQSIFNNEYRFKQMEQIIDDNVDILIREDSETFHNSIDTHADIVDNKDIYTSFFQDQIDIFEERTGFKLS